MKTPSTASRRLTPQSEHSLEVLLVLIVLALACMLYSIERSQVVVLNLFFMPVVLAAFFLGSYRAGVLALFSVIAASCVIFSDVSMFLFIQSPLSIGLSVVVWGAVLGLTTILVGVLSDDRNARTREMDEAHLGVIEVLTRYLQGADPESQAQSSQADRLALEIADRMGLSSAEIENMRRAALLMNLQSLEITSRVVRRAVHDTMLHASSANGETDQSFDSLGSALRGAYPLVLGEPGHAAEKAALGTRILHAARRFVELQASPDSAESSTPLETITTLRDEAPRAEFDGEVLRILEEIAQEQMRPNAFEPPHRHPANLEPSSYA